MKTVIFAMLGLLVVAGCGTGTNPDLPATVRAEGAVTLDGVPVDGAIVTFLADEGTYHATATTDAAGRFALQAFSENPGAVPGSYKVEVNKTIVTESTTGGGEEEPGEVTVKFGLPHKYATSVTSGLTCTIPDEGMTDIKLELTSQ